MKPTKILSNEEYNGLPFSWEDMVLKQVRLEEQRWYTYEKGELRKFEIKVEKLSAGLWNFLKTILKESKHALEQCRP